MTKKATKTQAKALLLAMVLNSPYKMVDAPEHVNKRTWGVIVREDWFDIEKNQITVEGMEAASVPIIQQPCIKLTRSLTYNHLYQKEKDGKTFTRSITFLPETVIMVTWRGNLDKKGKRSFIEGYVNLDGEQLFVRMYEPMRCEVSTIPIPNMDVLVKSGRVYAKRN
jgi:hypothetical protein